LALPQATKPKVFDEERPALAARARLDVRCRLPRARRRRAVLNLYSARHYQTDEALYDNFTKATGIKINRIEAGDEQLVERLKTEGAASPADVLLIVDAARLWQAQQLGLFEPVKSALLDEKIPAKYRDPGGNWFGFSYRARVIVYNKSMVAAADVATYESLADPKNKGRICTRSGSHPYNLSLIGSEVAHLGDAKAEAWAKGVVSNMARTPKGGDTDQIKAVAAGECSIALSNTYYYARLLRSKEAADKEIVAKTGVVFPDQASYGTHVNISGAASSRTRRTRRTRASSSSTLQATPRTLFRGRQQRVAGGRVGEGQQSRARRDGRVQDRLAADRELRQVHRGSAEDRRPCGLEVAPCRACRSGFSPTRRLEVGLKPDLRPCPWKVATARGSAGSRRRRSSVKGAPLRRGARPWRRDTFAWQAYRS
jgi:iron(III) transport system substrate-binding protein